MYEDIPRFWDAWDVEIYSLEKGWNVGDAHSITIVEKGPLRASIEISRKLSDSSSMVQRVSLCAMSRVLQFSNKVNWNESRRWLVRHGFSVAMFRD